MDSYDRAMLHLEEAKYHFNKALKIVTELAQEVSNARSRRTYDTVGKTEQANLASNPTPRLEDGTGVEPDGADRAKVVDLELRRERARAGIPTELRDIL